MTGFMKRSVAAAVQISAAAISTLTYAQNAPIVNYSSVDATSAMPVQLGYYASARKDCTPGPVPTIRVSQSPKLGYLTIRPAQLTTSAFAGCLGLKVPVEVVFYQARVGATGTDHVVYEVKNAGNALNDYDVSITIKEVPKGSNLDPGKPL